MIFETHVLKSPLNKYVESMFHFKDLIPEHSIERVVPTGHIYIIFELDGFPRCTYDNKTLKPNNTFSKVWISGMHKNYISISTHRKSEMFVIQFKSFGAYPYFNLPMHTLNEKIVHAKSIFGDEILNLRDDIATKETSEAKFKLAENWLQSKFQVQKTPPAEILSVVERLQSAAVSEYNQIIKSYTKTPKHLINQFKKYIGLTPKYYQRILRFNEILQQIHKSEKIEWSQIAYQCEYADQSHFIKEFKHFSGFNPQKFIQRGFHQNDTNFFPLDGKG